MTKCFVVMVCGYTGNVSVLKVYKNREKAEEYAREYSSNDGRNTFVIERDFVGE